MERLVKELLASSLVTQFYLESEVDGVRASVTSFNLLIAKFRSALRVSPLWCHCAPLSVI